MTSSSRSKFFKILTLVSCVFLIFYNYLNNIGLNSSPEPQNSEYYKHVIQTDTDKYLINTPRCRIPNYLKTMPIIEPKNKNANCGRRAVFIETLPNNTIRFIIDTKIMNSYTISNKSDYKCCYMFASPKLEREAIEDYRNIRYSSCKAFTNNTIFRLEHEVIKVTCAGINKKKHIYEDVYAMLKIKDNLNNLTDNFWNILLIGMDTMSQARVLKSMPQTAQYLKKNNWLKFNGYQKVDYNTFPNVAALLSGRNLSTINKACGKGMDDCNKYFLWLNFKNATYTTAYGEESLRLPDTFSRFNGFKNKPTDHYLRPLFLTGEISKGNIECTGKLPSTKHLLHYASDFARSYKDKKYFGFFWSNSYSHNSNNNPELLDKDMVNLLENLTNNNILENTLVFFLSDHGTRFGKMRMAYESYYDERLPMLFMWVPLKFQKLHSREFSNLQINQYRLTTPYDLYLTMWDILKKSNNSVLTMKSESCPNCSSIFEPISPYRTCRDAGVDNTWCSCRTLIKTSNDNPEMLSSVQVLIKYIQNKVKSVKTKKCTECTLLELNKIFRAHMYTDNSTTNYVVGISTKPGNIVYEGIIVKKYNNFSVLEPIHAIATYQSSTYCITNPYDREYCICKNVKSCKMKH